MHFDLRCIKDSWSRTPKWGLRAHEVQLLETCRMPLGDLEGAWFMMVQLKGAMLRLECVFWPCEPCRL